LRQQIQKVTEAVREPMRALPALPMESEVDTVPPPSEPARLRILKVTPEAKAVPPSVESKPPQPQPEPTRLRIVEVTPEATSVPTSAAGPVAPLPEPVRLRILEISEAVGPVIINRVSDEAKIRITGVQDAPPARPRIMGIIVTPQKD
jgi:hypothetical protein